MNQQSKLLSGLTSQVGRKILTGITGVLLVLYVIAHLSGNLSLLSSDHNAFNKYGAFLHSFGTLFYVIEIGLAVVILLHAYIGISIALRRRQARKQGYQSYNSKGGNSKQSMSSRTMAITGTVLLLFIIIHVIQFRFGPGPAEGYTPAGHDRILRLGRELTWLRARAGAPLTDLVADAERMLLLDVETVARPGPVGRAHLDAFADVVAEFSAGAEVATLPALLDYLHTAEQAEDGLTPGEVDVAQDRVQVLTVHAAKGLEWEVVAVPHLVSQVFPGRKIGGTWLTDPSELPVALRGDAVDLPGLVLPPDGDRKQLELAVKAHSEALDERRLVEERRLFYVALTRAERVLLVSGHRWPAAGEKPRQPSEFLTEIAEALPHRVQDCADSIRRIELAQH